MADYYSLLKSAVAKLSNNTEASRAGVYRQVRTALNTKLRSLSPPWPEASVAREQQKLEEAIQLLETEYGVAEVLADIDFSAEPAPSVAPAHEAPAPPVTEREPVAAVGVQEKPQQNYRGGAKVVSPKFDYEVSETGDYLTYDVKTRSRVRIVLAHLFALPLLLFAMYAIPIGMIDRFDGAWTTRGLIALGAALLAYVVGYAKTSHPVEFDRDSITVNGKKYLLSHVSQMGVSGGSEFIGLTTGAALASSIAEQAGYYIYIVYGSSDQIPIIKGLDYDRAQIVYHKIVGFLSRFGYKYRPH